MSRDTRSDPARRRSVTSVDIARAAGVSQTTVSLVFSGKAAGRISEETQRIVRETAERLGYVPNASARVLRGGSPSVIALAVPNVRHEYFGQVLLSAEYAARAKSMAVMLIDTASDPEWVERLIAMERAQLLAGVIVYAESNEVTDRLEKAVNHLLRIESGLPEAVAAIELDIAPAMEEVVDHLWGLGHRRIGHARSELDRNTFALRAAHLRASLNARGVAFEDHWQYRSSFEYEYATPAAVRFLLGADVTAVFCDDDIIAANLYRACRQLELCVPDDLSIIGFNDIDLARYLEPELTSVAIPAQEVGRRAVENLIAAIQGDPPNRALIPLQLNLRASTARPRRRIACVPDRK